MEGAPFLRSRDAQAGELGLSPLPSNSSENRKSPTSNAASDSRGLRAFICVCFSLLLCFLFISLMPTAASPGDTSETGLPARGTACGNWSFLPQAPRKGGQEGTRVWAAAWGGPSCPGSGQGCHLKRLVPWVGMWSPQGSDPWRRGKGLDNLSSELLA